MKKAPHGKRAHAKYAASGAKRWIECPGSIALSEGVPSRDSAASIEGTQAHEVLESVVHGEQVRIGAPRDMIAHAEHAARFILALKKRTKGDLLIEEKVSLAFLHPEAYGTLDYAVLEHFGTLHILDFKYGRKMVSPKENYQFIFYALAVAHLYDWNFARVRMWTLQPRVPGFDGNYTFWEIPISRLKSYIRVFADAFRRIEKQPHVYKEGEWCFFCPGKSACPLKQQDRMNKVKDAFSRPE